MKRTRIIVLILSLLLIIIGCTSDDTTSTTSLTTTKDTPTTTTVDNNSSTTSSKEITTTKEDAPTTTTTFNEPTTTKEVVTTTKENITTTTEEIITTQEPVITTTQEIVTTTEEITTTTQENITTEHVHEYNEWHATKNPSCIEDGIEERMCSCGESESRIIDALGHNYSKWTTVSEPTDNKNGKRERTCLRCGHKEEEIIDSLSYINSLLFKLSDDESYYEVALQSDYSYDTVVFPSTYLGKPVKKISNFATPYSNPLKYIYIPSSITIIGDCAFRNISKILNIDAPSLEMWQNIDNNVVDNTTYNLYIDGNLFTDLIVPGTTKSFDTKSFRNCVSLKTITFSEGVENICDFAFFGCVSIESLTIPSTVKSIGKGTFAKCKNVKLYISDINQWLSVSYFDENINNVNTLTGNQYYMTYDLYLNGEIVQNLIIPSNHYEVGPYVFRGCTSITSVTFPNSVAYIEQDAFRGCSSITSITIPNSVIRIEDNAFYNCSSITSITIPNSVQTIGSHAFYDCLSLKSISLPFVGDSRHSPTDLNQYPLGYIFGNGNYNNKTGTTQYYIGSNENQTTEGYYAIPASLKEVIITDSDYIPYGAFYNCSNIVSINIPKSVNKIGNCAFKGCLSLSYIFYAGSKSEWLRINIGSENNIDKDNMLLFYDDIQSLTRVKTDKYQYYLDDNNKAYYLEALDTSIASCNLERELEGITVVSLANYAFNNCSYLTSITIPNSVQSIGKFAFNNCSSLNRVNISSLESWLNVDFANGYSNPLAYAKNLYVNDELLTDLIIPDTIIKINPYAFAGCESITSITIPNSVQSIGEFAFNNCSSLNRVNISSLESWCGIALMSSTSNPIYYAHKLYLNNVLLNEIEIPTGIESIGDYAFYNCQNVTSLIIPYTVTSIGSKAFCGCVSISNTYYAGSKAEWDLITIEPNNDLLIISDIDLYYGFDSIYRVKTDKYQYYVTDEDVVFDLTILDKTITSFDFEEELNGCAIRTIEDNTFEYCELLKSIVIPETVTSIGKYAFDCCYLLESVTIPTSVKKIGENAFSNCQSLKEVNIVSLESWCDIDFNTIQSNPLYFAHNLYLNGELVTDLVIPNTITSIGKYAFYSCNSLESVTISESVEFIGENAFSTSSNLKKTNTTSLKSWMNITFESPHSNPSSCSYNLYLNDELITSLVIPENTTAIKDYAFYRNQSLESITIPESVISIGNQVFYGCYDLKNVYIESLESWCNLKFGYSDSNPLSYSTNFYLNGELLSNLIIPDTITTISDCAFYGCISIESVTIPNSVTSIGLSAFLGCSNIKRVNISSLESWCNIDFSSYSSNPVYVSHNIYINNEPITNLVIPDGVQSVKKYAFNYCYGISSVKIPSSLLTIESNAFGYCYNIAEIINNSNIELTLESNTNGSIAYYANAIIDDETKSKISIVDDVFVLYTDDDNVMLINYLGNNTNITLPNTITSIGQYVFCECSFIESIIIPDGITSIGKYAFYNCGSLKSITIPNSVQSIGQFAFSNCSSLNRVNISSIESWCNLVFENINSNPLIYAKNLYLDGELIVDLVIPEGVTSINSFAFDNVLNISSVTIPKSVTTIGQNAFHNCYKLKEVVNKSNLDITPGLNSNGYVAKYATVVINDKTKSTIFVTEDGFVLCSTDDSVKLVNYIGNEVSITIPDNVTLIDDYAFYRFTSLKSITIPNSVTSIGYCAFCNCSSLQAITIPNSVTSIGNSAFLNCSSLNRVNISSIESWCNITNYDTYLFAYAKNLYVNDELLTDLIIPDTITKINSYAFAGCKSITSVTIPNSVQSIGEFAFNNCSSLNRVNISSLESWCNIVFENTTSNPLSNGQNLYLNGELVTNLIIPDTITSIGEYTFKYCKSIESITIPANMTNIDINVFNLSCLHSIIVDENNDYYASIDGCLYSKDGIKLIYVPTCIGDDFVIPNTVNIIGQYAFSNNNTIKYLTIPKSVVTISDCAFYNCSSLVSIDLENGTTIGSFAFYNCSSMISIHIPSTLKSVGLNAFMGCTSLRKVNIDDIASWCHIYFNYSLPGYAVLPNGSYIYSANYYSNPLVYAGNLYLNDKLVVDLVIPDILVNIREMNFINCKSIRSITLPESLLSIKSLANTSYYRSDAFYGCTNLKVVYNNSSYILIEKGSSDYGCVGRYAEIVFNNKF